MIFLVGLSGSFMFSTMKKKVNSEPRPTYDFKIMSPPNLLTMSLLMTRPRPMPLVLI